MRLIDCFTEVLACTIEQISLIEKGEKIEFETIRVLIEGALTENAHNYIAGGYSEQQYEFAKFAAIAFVDEMFLATVWEHQERWKKELLQVKYYQTFNAGE
jgi:type VI protein secretion system component VasF